VPEALSLSKGEPRPAHQLYLSGSMLWAILAPP